MRTRTAARAVTIAAVAHVLLPFRLKGEAQV
jgi:hypothetical protein